MFAREKMRAAAHRELVVQASAKNVNRVRALLGQLAQCAADNFADKQAAYYAQLYTTLLCTIPLLCSSASIQGKTTNRQTVRTNKRGQPIALVKLYFHGDQLQCKI